LSSNGSGWRRAVMITPIASPFHIIGAAMIELKPNC
jgi:hypothetical protein